MKTPTQTDAKNTFRFSTSGRDRKAALACCAACGEKLGHERLCTLIGLSNYHVGCLAPAPTASAERPALRLVPNYEPAARDLEGCEDEQESGFQDTYGGEG